MGIDICKPEKFADELKQAVRDQSYIRFVWAYKNFSGSHAIICNTLFGRDKEIFKEYERKLKKSPPSKWDKEIDRVATEESDLFAKELRSAVKDRSYIRFKWAYKKYQDPHIGVYASLRDTWDRQEYRNYKKDMYNELSIAQVIIIPIATVIIFVIVAILMYAFASYL